MQTRALDPVKKPRKTKKKRARSRRSKRQALSVEARGIVHLEVQGLEIARGHDGFLRGAPEPVLVCAVFSLLDGSASLVARGISRFARPTEIPSTVRAPDPIVARGRRACSVEHHPLGVLVIAIEEDRGADIQRTYAMLQAHQELLLVDTSSEPTVLELADLLAAAELWKAPRSVDLLVDGERYEQSCQADKWISAVVFAAKPRTSHRVHLVSADQKNDWTAVVRLQ